MLMGCCSPAAAAASAVRDLTPGTSPPLSTRFTARSSFAPASSPSPAVTQQWGDLWVSVAIIFVGILAPLLLLHRRLHIGGNGLRAGGKAAAAAAALPQSGSAGAASNVSSASSAAIAGPTFGEFFTTHVFVSLYAGWVSVACIANVALAGTPVSGPPSNWGWSASNWSITMQVVASALALLMIALYR